MATTKSSTISLSKYAIYSCILYATLFLSQIYLAAKSCVKFVPIFIGPVYLPLVISVLVLILLIAVTILAMTKSRRKDRQDELAEFHRYKAGYITKYIFGLILILTIAAVKDFSPFFTEGLVHVVIRIFVLLVSLWEFIENLIFIILEKKYTE